MVSPPPSDRRGREGDSKKSGERRRRVVLEETHGSRRLLIIPVGKEKKKKNSFCTGCAPEGEIGGEKQFCFHGFFFYFCGQKKKKGSTIFTDFYSCLFCKIIFSLPQIIVQKLCKILETTEQESKLSLHPMDPLPPLLFTVDFAFLSSTSTST